MRASLLSPVLGYFAEDRAMNMNEMATALGVPLPFLLTGRTRPSKPKLRVLPGGKMPAPPATPTPRPEDTRA